MKFEYYNPNVDAKTFKSGKPKFWNRNDSSVRAICKAIGKDWITVYDELCNIGHNYNDMPSSKQVVTNMLSNYGYELVTLGKPVQGQKRPTIEEFAQEHNEGTYVLYLRDYYITMIDGVLYNTENFAEEKVYSYWYVK